MTIDEFIASRIKAINANFKVRNVRVASHTSWVNIKYQRRATIRKFIAELRLARNPRTAEKIADRVKWMVA